MDIEVINLPKLSESQIKISYNDNILSFIEQVNPDAGNLINQGFDLSLANSIGEIIFDFNHSDGNESAFISNSGSLVNLKFNVLTSNSGDDLIFCKILVNIGCLPRLFNQSNKYNELH